MADRGTRVLLALLSAALLASPPSPDIGWLGWCALVPLLLATQGLRPGQAAVHGLLTGIVAGFGIYGWLFEVPSFDLRHAVLLALYVRAYPAIWAFATAWALRHNFPCFSAVLWLVFDYLRGHADSSHFLGHLGPNTTSQPPLLQIASVIGERVTHFWSRWAMPHWRPFA
ncbi:MAG: hypothetical protein U0231_01060 [Nitrospiraceae bacterium]